MEKRRMCPNCRAFITTDDKVCPYCNEKVRARAVDLRDTGQMLMGFIPSARFVTSMVLLLNFAFFLGQQTSYGGNVLTGFGRETARGVLARHEYYRLVTAGFLHGGWLHILMNSWVLWDLGAQVEEIYGQARTVVFYFLATVCGFLATAYFSPGNSALGASAGLFGLIGVMIALGVKTRNSMGQAIRAHYIRWAIYGLIFGLLPGIANTAHVGGLAAGFGVAYVAGTPLLRPDSPVEAFWKGAAGLSILLTLVSFFQLYQQIAAPNNYLQ